MKDQDIIWIIVRSHIDVIKNPSVAKTVIIETTAYKPSGLIFDREFVIKDKETGEILVTAMTNWCLASLTTRRLVRPSIDIYPFTDDRQSSLYKEKLKSLPNINKEELILINNQKVEFIDLDHNRHMNNCRYLDIVTNTVLSSNTNEYISKLDINFEKECSQHDLLNIYQQKIDESNGYVVAINNATNSIVFKAKYTLSNNVDASKQTL